MIEIINDPFKGKGYDPSIYHKIEEDYKNGKKYRIEEWEWNYDSITKKTNKKVIKEVDYPTIKDFNTYVWDRFADFAQKDSYNFLFGPFGLKLRNPERKIEMYCDGIIYPITRQEFMECVENQNVSRFLSCMVHFGYLNINFILVE